MNNYKSTANNALAKILESFENGNIPQAIAYSTFNPPSNIPAYNWSRRNRALAFLQGTGDARGFKQWKEAGRHVKKGAKSIYILGPVLKKTNEKEIVIDLETGEEQSIDVKKCIGYYGIPVFRMEDTEGEPLTYASLEVQNLPLINVAKNWGIDVKAGAFNGNYYGYYSPYRQEIVMATDEEKTFLHELSHVAHYRIDSKAADLPKWQKEIIAELSAGALLHMLGKEVQIGNHYRYIKQYAEEAKIDVLKACMKILDICINVIDAILKEAEICEPVLI